jgi:Pyruvate/2-oxoacid:ferredoxin oxidoreductase delta subunit
MYYAAIVDSDKCSGCKLCIYGCPDPNIIAYCKESKLVSIDQKRCKGCGICITVCSNEALKVEQVKLNS